MALQIGRVDDVVAVEGNRVRWPLISMATRSWTPARMLRTADRRRSITALTNSVRHQTSPASTARFSVPPDKQAGVHRWTLVFGRDQAWRGTSFGFPLKGGNID